MLKVFVSVFMLLGTATAFAQPNSSKPAPDFSKLDPAWAAGYVDNDFQNGEARAAWRAIKRDFPSDYHSFVIQYANAELKHENITALSGNFIQQHIQGEFPFAARSPDGPLATLEKVKAKMIERLATSNVRACAAFASGAADVLQGEIAHLDSEITLGLYDIDAALFDAAAAGHAQPTQRRQINREDVLVVERLILAAGGSEGDAVSIFSREAASAPEDVRCRYGVLLYRALANSPDAVSAKFAFR